jgi:hypothetical protein
MEVKGVILGVDRNVRNLELLAHFLSKVGYETVKVSTDEDMAKVLTDLSNIQLALVDFLRTTANCLYPAAGDFSQTKHRPSTGEHRSRGKGCAGQAAYRKGTAASYSRFIKR